MNPPPESGDAVPDQSFAETGLTGTEYNQLRVQVQVVYFTGIEDSVVCRLGILGEEQARLVRIILAYEAMGDKADGVVATIN